MVKDIAPSSKKEEKMNGYDSGYQCTYQRGQCPPPLRNENTVDYDRLHMTGTTFNKN